MEKHIKQKGFNRILKGFTGLFIFMASLYNAKSQNWNNSNFEPPILNENSIENIPHFIKQFMGYENSLNIQLATQRKNTPAITQPDDYFRSTQNGDWAIPGTWESSPDNLTWSTATLSPDSVAKGITIQPTHTVNISSSISLDQTLILGTLHLLDGGVLNISDGFGNDLEIQNGAILLITTLSNYNTSIIPSASASLYTASGGNIIIGNGSSTGTGFEAFATSNANNWEDKSRFIWNNGLVFGTNGFTYFPNAAPPISPIFSIGPTVIPTISTAGALIVNGILDVRTNVTFIAASGARTFRDGITGNSQLTISNGGTQEITGSTAILGGSNLSLSLGKRFNFNTAGMTVTVPIDSAVTLINSGGDIHKASNVNFIINGTVDMTTINMDNTSGAVTISGNLRTAAIDGLIGSGNASISSGTINLNIGSTVEYYATSNQKISTTSLLGGNKYYNLIFSGDNLKSPYNNNPIIIDDAGSAKITGPPTLIVDASSNNFGPDNTLNTASLIMEGGRLKLGTLGFTGSGTLPSMKGIFNLTGGTIEFLGGTSATSQSIRSGGSYNYYNIEVSGPYVSTSGGNVNIKDDGSFVVNNGGVFTININSITGASNPSPALIRVKAGGIFNSGNIGGFNGRAPASAGDTTSSVHSNITNITLEPGSTINYSRDNTLAGDGNQPITNANGLVYQNLILSGTGNKIAPSTTLFIKGDFSKTTGSTFIHNDGTVEFNGTSAQSYISLLPPHPVFYNLNNNNTVKLNINAPLSVKNLLSLKDNSKINIDGDITLVSDNNRTASIDKIPEDAIAASITYGIGRFIVERYIPNHPRAWQLLSVPTKGSTIYESWQNSKSITPLRGINITDNRTDWSANGFDKKSISPSMKFYVPSTDSYAGVDKTSDQIDQYSSYFVFVRGDRSATDIGSPSTEVTLHTKGKIYAPTPPGEAPTTITVQPNSFALIGNPYPSSINYDDLAINGIIQSGYYIWDPQLTANPSVYGLGAFRSISGDKAAPEGGNYVDENIPPIQSGQAFFVYNPSGTPTTVSFSENAKTTGSKSIFRNKKGIPAPSAVISANLFLNNDNTATLLDGTKQLFNKSYSDETDGFDAKKLMNSSENIFLHSKMYPLAIERKTLPLGTDTTFLHLTGLDKRNYSIQLKISGLNKVSIMAFLNDKYTKMQQPLQEGINEYNFSVDNYTLASDFNRFFITFKIIPPPFAFKNEIAITKSESVDLKWETINSDQVNAFSVEFGSDTTQLALVKNIVSVDSNQFNWTHYPPTDGINYYRIKAQLKNGATVFSKTLVSEIHFPPAAITIYPNPVTDYITLKLTRRPAGKYTVKIFQADGKLTFSKYVYHTTSGEHIINMKGNAAGVYHLKLTGPGNLDYQEKIIIKR